MKFKKFFTVSVLLLLFSGNAAAIGIPTVDYKRLASLIAKHLPIKQWWEWYNNNFEGGLRPDGKEYRGLIKFDQLLNVNIRGNLENIGPKKFKELFSDELAEFQNTFLNADYYKSLITEEFKTSLHLATKKDYDRDVMSATVKMRNKYYANNPTLQAKMDKVLEQKKELYQKLVAMSQALESREETDQADNDRFKAICDYIDQADKGEDDPNGILIFTPVGNQHELVSLMAALQNEEIAANRGILELLRALNELDVYKDLEKLHEF